MREFSLIRRSRIAILLGNSRCFLGLWGIFKKIMLGILEFLQAKILKLEFLENYARNSSFTMLKTLKRQIGLAFFYIKNLAHSLKTFVNSSI